jgi:hypothetical protein
MENSADNHKGDGRHGISIILSLANMIVTTFDEEAIDCSSM